MQNQIKPPALKDNMTLTEMSKRVAEMMAAGSDMKPVDESFIKVYDKNKESSIAV